MTRLKMKPAVAAFSVLLITLLRIHTGSAVNPSHEQESADLGPPVKKLLEVKDETLRRDVKDLLEALLRILSKSQAQVTTATTAPVLNTTPPSTTPPSTTLSSTTPPSTTPPATIAKQPSTPPVSPPEPSRAATSAPSNLTTAPPAPKILLTGAKRGNQHSQRPPRPVITVESASANDKKGKGESNGPPKSDRKFLWIVLGVLGVVILVTILILKSKVLICARTHTKADVADYMEEKVYGKNEDVVLLGVTPGTEGEDDFYFSAQGCDGPMSQVTLQGYPGYEDISSRSTY